MKNKIVISIITIILLISILSLCLCACNPSALSGTYKSASSSAKIIFKSDGTFECEGLSWHGYYEIFDGTQVSVRIVSGSSTWKETWTLSKDRRQLKTSNGYVYNKV